MMERILNYIKLDFMCQQSWLKYWIIVVAWATLISFDKSWGIIGTAAFAVLFTSILLPNFFNTEERDGTDRLLSSLPLTQSDIVIGRYICGILLGVSVLVVSVSLGTALSTFFDFGPYVEMIPLISIAIGAILFFNGIIFPIGFRFGAVHAKTASAFPMIFFLALIMLFRYVAGVEFLNLLLTNIGSLVFLLGCVIFAIGSVLLSIRIRKKKYT